MTFDKVISVCSKKDIEFWKHASCGIINYVRSDHYEVIVPDAECKLFLDNTPAQINVIPESFYSGHRSLDWLRDRLPNALRARAGWYLQQYLKIEAIRTHRRDGLCLVWDADTVPLRDLDFKDSMGRIVYRTGIHKPAIHQPYFDIIKNVTGIDRKINDSFISQCFPARQSWIREMCDHIQERNSKENWWEVIVDYIANHPSACGFSEYETMGTWIYERYPTEITITNGKFFRPGNSIFPIEKLDPEKENYPSRSLEYIAYDDYDRTIFGGLNIGCGNNRLLNTFDNKKFINADISPTPATDMVIDLNDPLPFYDESFTQIIAHNVLEHVDDVVSSITELDRVLVRGGVIHIEVPHIGSYNHGTDVTHKRGMTFDSFNFLLRDPSYLYTRGGSPFKYRLISFNRENLIDGRLSREQFDKIPPVGTYSDWLNEVKNFRIPGTFGFIFQKI